MVDKTLPLLVSFSAATKFPKQLFFQLKFLMLVLNPRGGLFCKVYKITFGSFSEISKHEKLVCFTSYCICYLYYKFFWKGIWFYV